PPSRRGAPGGWGRGDRCDRQRREALLRGQGREHREQSHDRQRHRSPLRGFPGPRRHGCVPALVPSLANPKSQASFGFVVQGGGTPAGTLEYNDKPAGVRIKATSIDTLFITAGSCGPNTHATFTGMAAAPASTGTL